MTLLTYEQQLDLVNRKLATKKTDGNFDTFKYHRRVMYDYLWDTEPNLLECRGHVYDNRNGKLVQAAPTKTFNYLENNNWSEVPLDTVVTAHKKINGYMACASLHNGEVVVSTTGSTNSDYAQWAKKLIFKCYNENKFQICEHYSDLFEIVVPQDPHIVAEKQGCHWLGYRNKRSGQFVPVNNLRPLDSNKEYLKLTLGAAIELAKTDRGEGFMLYDTLGNCCKLKTDYYVGKKKLMRANDKGIDFMYNHTESLKLTVPSVVHPVIDFLVSNKDRIESWKLLPEQDRRKLIESIIGE